MDIWAEETISRFETGLEGCDTCWALGYLHGHTDYHNDVVFAYRPYVALTEHETGEYQDGYREGYRGC